jgi:hypothetical protein
VTDRNIVPLSEEKARLARLMGMDLCDHAELIGARAVLRSPLHQSDADLRNACSVLLRLGDWRDGQVANHILLMLDRADLRDAMPDPVLDGPNDVPARGLAANALVLLCAALLALIAVWVLS